MTVSQMWNLCEFWMRRLRRRRSISLSVRPWEDRTARPRHDGWNGWVEQAIGDIFGSASQLMIEEVGRRVTIYLRGHKGRGICLGHKLCAYSLQELTNDTVGSDSS
uniref:3,4-dihydroxy-2-butanone-4-phosphate synthase n=1 Tax=Kalanchoe fedtschenkoi TaxID=63787 RepID=A0A7N0RAM3_KALFE